MTKLFTKLASGVTALALVASFVPVALAEEVIEDITTAPTETIETAPEEEVIVDSVIETSSGEESPTELIEESSDSALSTSMLLDVPVFAGTGSLGFDALDSGAVISVVDDETKALHEEQVLAVADRLVSLQEADGSWGWNVTGATGPVGSGFYNVTGVTASALLDAYSITRDDAYLNALKDAGNYIKSKASGFATDRQNAYNIVFLYDLAEVSGDASYATTAGEMLEIIFTGSNYWGSCGVDGCSPEELVSAYVQYRGGSDADTVAWDIAPFVEALTDAGENGLAQSVFIELAELNVTSALGLAAELRAAVAIGSVGDIDAAKSALLATQSPDGGFGDIQGTAYALTALVEAGDVGVSAASYLSSEIASGDRWIETDGKEYAEIDSEAAHALAQSFYVTNTRYSIQDAIDTVTTGGTVQVSVGTYEENVLLNKAVSLLGSNAGANPNIETRGNETIITGQVNVHAGGVVIDGFTVTNPSYIGPSIKGVQVYGSNAATLSDIVIQNNIIRDIQNGMASKGATGIQVQGNVDQVQVLDNKISNLTASATGGWVHAVEVTPGSGVTNVPQNVTIQGNHVSAINQDSFGAQSGFTVDSDGSVFADASEITFFKNSLIGVNVRNLDDAIFNVSGNYWGSDAGPSANQTSTNVAYENWYTDAALTVLNTDPVEQEDNGGNGRSGGSRRTTITSAGTTGTVDGGNTGAGQVLGASTYSFSANLTTGSNGADVTALQQMLIDAGLLKIAAPTGFFGPMTTEALKAWQAAHGVPATGFFGPLTMAAITAASTPAMSAEARAALIADLLVKVKELQEKLEAMEDGA